jgi:hypothetical protein
MLKGLLEHFQLLYDRVTHERILYGFVEGLEDIELLHKEKVIVHRTTQVKELLLQGLEKKISDDYDRPLRLDEARGRLQG